jgi:polyribonucleotide nucleotidyltransferase
MGNEKSKIKIPSLTTWDEEDKCYISVITIPKELQKHLIGEQGKNIKNIQETCKVKIRINDEQCVLTSTGKNNNQKALLMANNSLEEAGWYYDESGFVEKPIDK